jgi:phosphoribosylformylglycinamidine synthase
MPVHRLEIEGRPQLQDALGESVRARLSDWLGIEAAAVRTRKVYLLDLGLDAADAQRVLEALTDPIAEVGGSPRLADTDETRGPAITVEVGFLPGVTDVVGKSVKRAAEDRLGRALEGAAYSGVLYRLWGVEEAEARRAVAELLHNPLIERAQLTVGERTPSVEPPRAGSSVDAVVRTIALRSASDDELRTISDEGTLALNLSEMRAIAEHFRGRDRDPTDAELECLAQTWSEHCKHKIFASPIHYVDPEGVEHEIEGGLFRTWVRGATVAVAEGRGEGLGDAPGRESSDPGFLVSVFHDNAGVVRFTDSDHLVYKVETHNSPSALDPYGGAMTGIVGVNRDSFGTGLGADLLTNVWGYCFGDPRHEGALPKGLMHPRRIRDGVHDGVVDGGNHSGIPYSRGFELFDERFVGKPLVYCGTLAVMPAETAGRPTHRKVVAVGDAIVMVGGRIGKDGIHGATFSSARLDDTAPVQAVQIGDPITQRMMWDMLAEARDRGLYSGLTDNVAGGLSSSVVEMAELTGGARLDLARAPLKYPGLAPWEILISEAQERMTVAVPPTSLDEFLALAEAREVEATVLGEFTDNGRFEVTHGEQMAVDLSLEFLHDGVPLPTLSARWSPPKRAFDPVPECDVREDLLRLLARPNLASGEERARHYDHEVKGLSVVKPLLGVHGSVPATATVMRARHGRDEGVVLAEGIHPFYSDLDTRAMAMACVDEGVRRVLCAGARLDRIAALDNFCWPDPIASERTPDGEHKLAQLVRCNQGLYDACVAYDVPLISGKDSMKNDAFLGGVKISIPPTLLVSVVGQMPDVRRALTLETRGEGEIVFALGATREELGASAWARMHGVWIDGVPRTNAEASAECYRLFSTLRDDGVVRSAHVVGRGGMLVALAHIVMASEFGLEVELAPGRPSDAGQSARRAAVCFSESTGRIVFSVHSDDASRVRDAFAGQPLQQIGRTCAATSLSVESGTDPTVVWTRDELCEAFEGGLRGL